MITIGISPLVLHRLAVWQNLQLQRPELHHLLVFLVGVVGERFALIGDELAVAVDVAVQDSTGIMVLHAACIWCPSGTWHDGLAVGELAVLTWHGRAVGVAGVGWSSD